MVGLGVRFDDIVDYVSHNDLGTAVLLRSLARGGFTGRFVLGSSMVVYGEGRYRCQGHGVVRPPPRDPEQLATGRFDHICPRCGAGLIPEPVPEDAPIDPRNVYASTKAHQEALCFSFGRELGVRSRRCGITTCTVRGCHGTRRTPAWPASSGARWQRGWPRASSRTGARCGTSCTCGTWPGPTSWR